MISYTMNLGCNMATCPTCWAGFIESIFPFVPGEARENAGGIPVVILNKFLEEYNAIYSEDNLDAIVVEFKDEEDAVAFKLKFGL